MGVRGLSSWLANHGVSQPNLRVLPRGGMLYIDGLGFAFFLWHHLPAIARFGDYAALRRAATASVAAMRAAGLTPVFYFDGRATRLKARTLQRRRIQRADLWEAFFAASLDGRRVADAPEPLLLQQQLEWTLMSIGVHSVHCDCEADAELARACVAALSSGREAWVCANDTDFLLYASVRYVHFSELTVHTAGAAPASRAAWQPHQCPAELSATSDLVATGRVWSRSLLLDLSGLRSEAWVVTWAVLAGNDHTAHFPADEFGDALAPVVASGRGDGDEDGDRESSLSAARLEAIRLWLREHAPHDDDAEGDGTDGRLGPLFGRLWTGASPDVLEAVRFSMALYEHEETTAWPVDTTRADDAVEVLRPAGCTTIGEVAIREVEHGGIIFRHRAHVEAPTTADASAGASTPAVAAVAAAAPDGTRRSSPRHGSARCEEVHGRALRRVLAGERLVDGAGEHAHGGGRDGGPASIGASAWPAAVAAHDERIPRLTWSDVLVGRRYEAACKLLLRSGFFDAAEPAALFDGPSFHHFCAVERERARAAPSRGLAEAPSPSPSPSPSPPSAPRPDALPTPSAALLQKRPLADGRASGRPHRAVAPSSTSPWARSTLAPLQALSLHRRDTGGAGGAGGRCASTPSTDAAPRRKAVGPCAQCGRTRRGEHDETEPGTPLYCLPCWLAYDAATASAPCAIDEALQRGTEHGTSPTDAAGGRTGERVGGAQSGSSAGAGASPAGLPVDAFEGAIRARAVAHRVVVITGETGCGKSSRVPMLLLDACAEQGDKAGRGGRRRQRIFVAQPRRIAAFGLHQRAVSQGHGELVGLRMGQDTRIEGPRTRLLYVTTGYLARLASCTPPSVLCVAPTPTRPPTPLAPRLRRMRASGSTLSSHTRARNADHPEAFADVAYLVLDECHERSIEADVLCLLARRLLARYPRLTVVLMSATVHTELYRSYFAEGIPPELVAPPLHVGGSRFPIEVRRLPAIPCIGSSRAPSCVRYHPRHPRVCTLARRRAQVRYLDAIERLPLPERLHRSAGALATKIDRLAALPAAEVRASHSAGIASAQLELAVWVVRLAAAAAEGAAVLVFVAGLAEIEELAEQLAHLPTYQFVPIHSDFTFEEQLAAFAPAPPGVTKIIAATNAAESSVTLPDVDVVVDLGAAKTVHYDAERRASVLSRMWVSRASATQRAGRTGRVRAGVVYRLFTESLFTALPAHDSSAIREQPLESTILQARTPSARPECRPRALPRFAPLPSRRRRRHSLLERAMPWPSAHPPLPRRPAVAWHALDRSVRLRIARGGHRTTGARRRRPCPHHPRIDGISRRLAAGIGRGRWRPGARRQPRRHHQRPRGDWRRGRGARRCLAVSRLGRQLAARAARPRRSHAVRPPRRRLAHRLPPLTPGRPRRAARLRCRGHRPRRGARAAQARLSARVAARQCLDG